MPPYAEQTIVHGGSQSMPLVYDVDLKYAEATLALTYPIDWTEGDVETLTVWFRGDAANTEAPIYVALNDNAIVAHDDAGATLIDAWTQWDIPLQAFADLGVGLTNVSTIAVGVGDKANVQPGGTGTMYIDDIGVH
jgi:hypothetical protein